MEHTTNAQSHLQSCRLESVLIPKLLKTNYPEREDQLHTHKQNMPHTGLWTHRPQNI